jgi:hypothetical protein
MLAAKAPGRLLPLIAGGSVILATVSAWGLRARGPEHVRQSESPVAENPPSAAEDLPPLPPPPPLPAPGTADSLMGLAVVPVESLPRFETRESQYEAPAVTVYGRRRDWFLVGLRGGGRDWLHSRSITRYHAIENLLQNRLNYLTESWDGRIRNSPDAAAPARTVAVPAAMTQGGARRDVPANVVEASANESGVWLKVEVLDRSPCEGGDPPRVIATGWIPVWSRDGRPTAWFHSRGC